jgi:hypothetical protein
LTLGSYEAVAGPDLASNYSYTLKNVGSEPVLLGQLTIQSWYSADAVLGGPDDCGAAGAVLDPQPLAPGASVTLSFFANLEPSPVFWPQCVSRDEGFVIVHVHTNPPYAPNSCWAAYPVTR